MKKLSTYKKQEIEEDENSGSIMDEFIVSYLNFLMQRYNL